MPSAESVARVRAPSASDPELVSVRRVGGDPLAGRQPGQILLLLLFGAKIDQRQRPDRGVRRHRDRESTGHGHLFGDDRRDHLGKIETAICLRDFHGQRSKLTSTLHQRNVELQLPMLHAIQLGKDVPFGKLTSDLGQITRHIVEIFWREDRFRPFEHPSAALAGDLFGASHGEILSAPQAAYTSKRPAAPMPPPMHMVTSPVPPPRRRSSWIRLVVSFAPVAPNG